MSAIDLEKVQRVDGSPSAEGKIVEVTLLLEPWLLTALEATASEQGLTTGMMVRRLIRDFLYYSDGRRPDPSRGVP
jgi:hypothetical protein